jgi:hypothetical protein
MARNQGAEFICAIDPLSDRLDMAEAEQTFADLAAGKEGLI